MAIKMESKQQEIIKVKLIVEYHENLHFYRGKNKVIIRMAEEYPFLRDLLSFIKEHGEEKKGSYYTTYIIELKPDELLQLMRPKRHSKYYEAVKELVSSS